MARIKHRRVIMSSLGALLAVWMPLMARMGVMGQTFNYTELCEIQDERPGVRIPSSYPCLSAS